MEGPVLVVAGVAAGLAGIWLLCQRWFWLTAIGLGAVAAGFTMLANIFHFQILAAMGFFVLMSALAGLFYVIAEA